MKTIRKNGKINFLCSDIGSRKLRSALAGGLKLATIAFVATACGVKDGSADEDVAETTSPLTLSGYHAIYYSYQKVTASNGAVRWGYWNKCAANEVAVGWHAYQNKVLCAYTGKYPVSSVIDSSTQIPFDGTSMHGCPDNFFVQGIMKVGGGEYLYCVNFGSELYPTTLSYDIQSNQPPWNFSSPTMHVCGANEGLRGVHQTLNVFTCAQD